MSLIKIDIDKKVRIKNTHEDAFIKAVGDGKLRVVVYDNGPVAHEHWFDLYGRYNGQENTSFVLENYE